MKKTLFIVAGILLIIIIGGVWAYLFVFGTPDEGEGIFSNFGFGGDRPEIIGNDLPAIVDTSGVDATGADQRLRQLTTRPVAGATFIEGGIRYAERGTGHIYDIMFSNGNESLVSGVTVARVVEVVFSPEGNRVALISNNDNYVETYVGTLTKNDNGEGSIDGISLPLDVREISFGDTGEEVYFLEETDTGASGRAYNLVKETTRTLFSIPLRDVEVLWGDDMYVYTTPSAKQTGYLYEITGSGLGESLGKGEGLTALQYSEGYIVTNVIENDPMATAYEDESSYMLPIVAFPEKCASKGGATSTLVCAEPLELTGMTYPDDWYKGTVSLSDALWSVDVASGEASLISDFRTEAAREIDVSAIGIHDDGRRFYFINKNDDSLWMYDTTL